ncbi:MAG: c-type cytochrome [Dongiaceae bacterium]
MLAKPSGRLLLAIALAALATAALMPAAVDDTAAEALTNPLLGDPQAIAEGRRIYRMRCVICHAQAGARGPDLFATRLGDEQFLEIVINGRKGTQMPAFGYRLSPDEVWQVHAFVKSTDHYE